MKYLELVENLQKSPENQGTIVLIKNGIFFVGIGKDALILNQLLGLKCTCMKDNLCKVGFQVKSLEKYITKIQKLDRKCVIYDYNRETEKEDEIIRIDGRLTFEKNNCKECQNCNNKKETVDEIIERVKRNAGKR